MYGVPVDLPIQRFLGDTLSQVCIGCDGVHFRFGRTSTISAFGLWQLHNSSGTLIDQTQEHSEREFYRIHLILNANVTACSMDAPRSFSLTFSTGHQLTFIDDTPQYESCTVYFDGGSEVII